MKMEEKGPEEKNITEIIEMAPEGSPSENVLVTEHLQRMPAIFARGLLYLLIALLVVALIYSLVAKIDVVVESKAVAQPGSNKIKLLSDRNGYIDRILIVEGQTVEKNAPLFVIRSKETLAYTSKVEELDQIIPLKKEYYDTKISSLHDALEQADSDFTGELNMKKLKLDQNSAALKANATDLAFMKNEIASFAKEFENTKRLFDKSLTSIGDYNSIKSRLERSRGEVEKLTAQHEIAITEKQLLEKDIEKSRTDHLNKKRMLEKELKNLRIERETTLRSLQNEQERNTDMLSIKDGAGSSSSGEKGYGNIIRAGQAGTVSELYFKNTGEYVRDADLLCTLVPADSPLYMDITVANKGIGFIKKGMPVKYKFDAFPYTDYGTRRGEVVSVSPSAVESGALGFVYTVRGSLKEPYYEIRGAKYFIKAGMTATAELVTEEKSIFSILVAKLKR
ncbi:MAG: HlyD family efflux transporter periplasmic adaptor subunit [Nitrospirae bacterium]|nr:HlyD family efflux transporter periplasmic adaptor subunit [Nitrospirota bacterium]